MLPTLLPYFVPIFSSIDGYFVFSKDKGIATGDSPNISSNGVFCLHYETHDQVKFPVIELVYPDMFSGQTWDYILRACFFHGLTGNFLTGSRPGMTRRKPGKTTCDMSAIPGFPIK